MTEPIDLYERITTIHKRTVSLTWLAALTGLLALSGCESGTNSGMGTVRLQVASIGTAAMLEAASLAGIDDIASAIVTIDRAELMPGHVEALLSTNKIDLLALGGDVTVGLGSVPTPLGTYEQLRLIVSNIEVTLKGSTDPLPSRVPSGPQTGIKIDFAEPVEVGPGDEVDLLVTFNVAESFVFQGPPTAPTSVSFRPVIHVSTSEEAASIGGDLTVNRPAGTPDPVEVTVTASDASGPVASVKVTIPADASSGSYLLRYMQPGISYTVAASADGFPTVTESGTNPVTTGAGSNTGPTFTLAP